ncbi:MAG: hypothetical protein AAF290_00090 [Pseudomonadota bacterium]
MSNRTNIPVVATTLALCLGYYTVVKFIWGYIAVYNPVSYWLVADLAPVRPGLSKVLMLSMDLAINFLLAYPFALLLFRLRRPELWIGMAVFAAGFAVARFPLRLLDPVDLLVGVLTSFDFWMLFSSLLLTIWLAGRIYPRQVGNGI